MTLNKDTFFFKSTLKRPELVVDVSHLGPAFLKSISVNALSVLLLLDDQGLFVLFKSKLTRDLEVYSNGLSPMCA